MIKISGAHVVSPKEQLDGKLNVVFDEATGKIVYVGDREYEGPINKEIVADGLYLLPGLIDMHVHLREPGFPEKETIYTGTRAAVHGGVTTLVCMPNTSPALDSSVVIEELHSICARDAACDVYPCGAITMNIEGEQLAHHDSLVEVGVVAISDDGRTTMNDDYMKQAFESSKRLEIPVMTHSEDHEITVSLHGANPPAEAENNIVFRDIQLCDHIGGHLHICHVSTKEAVYAIEKAKQKGVNVTGEATPHHFTLTRAMIDLSRTSAKVNPPIRDEEDRLAIVEALRTGVIDVISTDHAPHEVESKEKAFNQASFGISGIETSFALAYTTLVKKHGFPFSRLVELMSEKPAELLKLEDRGVIKEGMVADMVLVNLEKTYPIDVSTFVSKGKNTPFHGFSVTGKVEMTIARGTIHDFRGVYVD